MTTQLTPAQHAILDHAHRHTEGKIEWFPDNIKGGARQKVIECDLFKQVLDGLGVLLLHRLGLSIAGCVEDDVIDALFQPEAKLFLIPGDSLAFA